MIGNDEHECADPMADTGSRTAQAPRPLSFPERLYLISLMYPRGVRASDWLQGALGVSQGLWETTGGCAEEQEEYAHRRTCSELESIARDEQGLNQERTT